MVVKSERTGERPEAVEIAGTDVWLRRGIAEGEREEQGGEGGSVKVKVFTYEELHFTDPTGELTVEGAKADFDTVWAAHEADGMSIGGADRIAPAAGRRLAGGPSRAWRHRWR